ncbi:MAG: peptidoglycan bridge formation glycyltransferase FemA/FemB family protein, partial [Anaerolineae bacterium]|nr:peptidoglycan bridge formation glycyltransferase FemA/FemB family protein [Anaerolineae bacterium]
MTLTPFSPTVDQWDAFVRAHPRGHALQLSAWGALKSRYEWRTDTIALADSGGQIVAGALILLKALPFRLGNMAYVPMGPLVTDSAQYPILLKAIRDRIGWRKRVAFLKIEPGIFDSAEPDWRALGLIESLQTVQPPRTILIDLTASNESILARMNQGTRRKLRQSIDKNGVTYREAATVEEVARFTDLMQVTGSRNEFGVHEPAYYQQAFQLFAPHDAALILAEHEGDTLAGVFVFTVGQTAWYLYGASSNEKRNLMGSYGAQWHTILWARARGCVTYDLWGIPDEPETTLEAQFQTREDGLWGVYGFKRGWGGQVIRSAGAWDQVYNPV